MTNMQDNPDKYPDFLVDIEKATQRGKEPDHMDVDAVLEFGKETFDMLQYLNITRWMDLPEPVRCYLKKWT